MHSKSLSPIIGTLIILGIALVVAGITYTWTSTYTQEQTKAVEQQADVNTLVQAQSAIGLVLKSASTTGKLIVANNSSQPLIINQLMVDGNFISIPPVTIPAGGIASIDANILLSEGQSITLITTAGASKTMTVTGEALTQYTSTLSFSDLLNNSNYLNASRTDANITSGEARLSTIIAWLDLGDLNISKNDGNSVNAALALDVNGNPHIAWMDDSSGTNNIFDIYYRDWNGSNWVTVKGNLSGDDLNVSNTSGVSWWPSLKLDVNGNPHIEWFDNTPGNNEIYYRDWNGSDWVTAAGDLGGPSLNVSNNSGNSVNASLALDANGNPSIAWQDLTSGNREVYYRDWNGSNWVTVNGNLFDDDLNVSKNSGWSRTPLLALDANGNPGIAWFDNTSGNYEIYYTKWNGIDWVTAKGSGGTALNNFLWVANHDSGTVSKINKATNEVEGGPISVGTNPYDVAVDDAYVWITNSSSNTVSKINKATNLVEATIPVGSSPIGIAVDNAYVWVTNYSSNNVSKINKATNLVEAIIPVGTMPHYVAVDETYVWVTNAWDGTVSKITKATNTPVTFFVGWSLPSIAVDSTYAWAISNVSQTVSKINKSSNSIEATLGLGATSYGIAVDNTYVWIANTGSNNVLKINKTPGLDATIPVGSSPIGIAVDDAYVWVTNSGSSTVSKINKATNAVVATIAVGSNVQSMEDATGYAFDFFGFGNTNDLNVSKNSGASWFPSLKLDANGNPHIAWYDNTPGNNEIYYRDWNGSNWVTAAGDLAGSNLNASNTSGDSTIPSLELDANSNPRIAWSDDTLSPGVAEDIYYRDWNGSDWVTAAGDLAGSSLNASNTSGDSWASPWGMALNAAGKPRVTWEDYTLETPEIYYREWAEGFPSGNRAESIEVDSVTAIILRATLIASIYLPVGTSISFYLSNDTGSTWQAATSGVEVSFSSTGSQLKWRADLNSSSTKITPRIYDISINYVYEA